MVLVWLGFAFSLVFLLTVAHWSLWLAMFGAALVLGVFALSPGALAGAVAAVLADPSVMLLGLAVSIIPMIGGSLERTGRMDSLVNNMRIPRRAFVGVSPALLGMLPMPGGALLSAPLVERAGGAPADLRAAANVWFRHALLLVYPLSPALIAGAKLAGLEVWEVISYQLPALALTVLLGYVFFLRRFDGAMERKGVFSLGGLLAPLGILLVAPGLDFAFKRLPALPVAELATVIGVSVSLALAVWRRMDLRQLGAMVVRGKPWRFGLIVVGMFSYLAVFQASGAAQLIADLHLSPQALCVGIALLLGLATGRQQAPASIVIPIFLAAYGVMTPWAFAITYFAVYIGFVMSPVHPCVTVSAEYAGTTLAGLLRRMLVPSLLGLAALLGASYLVF
ncbi:MAG: DUF401 family protein [Candidatus Bipolaricaulota bacterium]